ncbi:DNAj [Anaeramoeba flamelloides]|uniref:DNAj n=1 Tax=Anaeramoeba flamelloides TaxID=1746091 RepID=A0AAV7YUY3_9EUKA|nr:DNAj [Anaeramoeba flamelloides]
MNYYDLLGVPIAATSKEIKTAYKRLALTNHPDKVPKEKQNEAVTKFKMMNKAYQTLTNSNSRYEYDEKLNTKNFLQMGHSHKYPKQQDPFPTKIYRSKPKEKGLSNSQPSFSFNKRETTDLLNDVLLNNKYSFFSVKNQTSKQQQKQKQKKERKSNKSNNKHNHSHKNNNNNYSHNPCYKNSNDRTNKKEKKNNNHKNYSKTTTNKRASLNINSMHPSNFSKSQTSSQSTPFKKSYHFSNNHPNSNSKTNSKTKSHSKSKSMKSRKKNQKKKSKLSPTIKTCALTLEEVYSGANQICSFERKYYDQNGNLQFKKPIEIEFPIPKGIKEGHEIVFRNKGDQKKGFLSANLIIKISIEKHKFFIRKGDDLCLTQKISIVQSLTYFIFQITLLNQKTVKLKFGYDGSVIKYGKELVIPDLGMPKENANEEFGDLIITFQVEFPESLTKLQKKLIINALGNKKKK